MPRCIEWAEEKRRECAEYRDEGYSACSDWDDRCCDWWPCSWGCKLITWICIGWYWVSNIVCVAWTWVTEAVCIVWDFVTTVVNAIIVTVELIVGWVLSAVAFVIELIFSIPVIGRVLKWIWNVILTIVWGAVGLVDAVLGVIGIRPEKKLRVCVIILRDEKGNPVAQPSDVVPHLQAAADIYRQEANVRVVPSGPAQYDSGFAQAETVDSDWVYVNPDSSGPEVLDVGCGWSAAGEDLWLTGSTFEFIASIRCFYGNWRRVLGYGAPVVVFIVRSVSKPGDSGPESTLGCGLGPLTDYVTIRGSNPVCIAHELGHVCNLWHVSDDTNLMYEKCGRRKLKWWQVAILRDSRHVSYF